MSENRPITLFTFGCSTHTSDSLVALLRQHRITAVVDVRSVPFSRFTPHFNREAIQDSLTRNRIHYLWMGPEFGARREETEAYREGRVDFSKVFQLEAFQRGVARLRVGLAKNYRIALMCTEKDPANCHRTIMVTRYLSNVLAWQVAHIHFDGTLETNATFEARIRALAEVEGDLFTNDPAALTHQAYQWFEARAAWRSESR